MNKFTAVLIDDEADGRNTLRCYLEKYCPEIVVVADAGSVADGVTVLQTVYPDIVFLDVNMPFENGFALFKSIPQPAFSTIFVTAYDCYALQAIKQHALDYLLKPIDIDELIAAVKHAVRCRSASVAKPGHMLKEEELSRLINEIRPGRTRDKIALPVLDGFRYVPHSDIVRCEAKGSYTSFHFKDGTQLLICHALGYYEAMLSPYGFIRVHHQHLINPVHVERYQRGRGGSAIMSDKSEVTISQRRRDDFLELMDNCGG